MTRTRFIWGMVLLALGMAAEICAFIELFRCNDPGRTQVLIVVAVIALLLAHRIGEPRP